MVETCVVYLVWGPLGGDPLERFAASYRDHPARSGHRFAMGMKGVTDRVLRDRCLALADELGAESVELAASGLDLDSYHEVATRIEADRLCFLNSSSEILADAWLSALTSALDGGAALAGATGSYESALSASPRPLKPFLRRRYPPFPNPHVRTNAFVLERELMLSLEWPASHGKRRALELESGRRSISRQIWERGLDTVVVGRDGEAYERDRWYQSRTFRSGEQENLLIADNRTREYSEAPRERREELVRYAWGATIAVEARPWRQPPEASGRRSA